MTRNEICEIELASLQAVSPESSLHLGQWLCCFDSSTIGRARTAVALSHALEDIRALHANLDAVIAAYRARDLRAGFRVPQLPAFSAIEASLRERGFAASQPTLVMCASCAAVSEAAAASSHIVQLSETPHDDWAKIYTSAGFDAVDGANRVRVLSRAERAFYADAKRSVDESAVASGMLALSNEGWASVHGLRTMLAARGQGLASAMLYAMAQAALRQSYTRCFLQVETTNPAVQLYERSGFERAWVYNYWYLN
jgi:N-acetylglutamate synthase